ncbi:MAG: ATP phosphoribosyltransferase regulatory subunit, partial [Methylobacteriaceae bacterium]|nr:ATP phosphoribosyltransferase regulatory subunit [Methylobacteriaceae bacterium]
EAIGLGGDENAGRRLTVLRALDKYDRLGAEGVRELLGPGRRDESGDFTKGAGLDDEAIDRLLLFLGSNQGAERVVSISALRLDALDRAVQGSEVGRAGVSEVRDLKAIVEACGYDDSRIVIDPSVVRGLEYYTGPVFEAELTFPVVNDDGQTVRFGSVAGGGRYDGLVGRFRPEPVPATGFSIGVSRLLSALQIVKSPIVADERARGPVVVLVMDRDRVSDYQRLVATLRGAGIRAELYLGSAGLKAQMKYADRRRAPCVVIQGSQERERGEVQIKDLVEGAEKARGEGSAASHAEYKAARLAQVSVPEAELVTAVQEVLARQRG